MEKQKLLTFLLILKNILTGLFHIWRVCCYYNIPATGLHWYSYFIVSET